jgi:hypothetical protein
LGLNTRILSAYMIVLAHKVQKEPLLPFKSIAELSSIKIKV